MCGGAPCCQLGSSCYVETPGNLIFRCEGYVNWTGSSLCDVFSCDFVTNTINVDFTFERPFYFFDLQTAVKCGFYSSQNAGGTERWSDELLEIILIDACQQESNAIDIYFMPNFVSYQPLIWQNNEPERATSPQVICGFDIGTAPFAGHVSAKLSVDITKIGSYNDPNPPASYVLEFNNNVISDQDYTIEVDGHCFGSIRLASNGTIATPGGQCISGGNYPGGSLDFDLTITLDTVLSCSQPAASTQSTTRRIPLAGDALKAGIEAVTFGAVKPCPGCLDRQAALNALDASAREAIRAGASKIFRRLA